MSAASRWGLKPRWLRIHGGAGGQGGKYKVQARLPGTNRYGTADAPYVHALTQHKLPMYQWDADGVRQTVMLPSAPWPNPGIDRPVLGPGDAGTVWGQPANWTSAPLPPTAVTVPVAELVV